MSGDRYLRGKNLVRHKAYQTRNLAKQRIRPIATALRVYTPAVTWELIVAFTALGLGMIFQPERFSRTPSYGNLIGIASIEIWGMIYFAIAIGLWLWRRTDSNNIGVWTHVAAAMLTFIWELAFIIRWRTDHGTTIVNVVSWGILLIMVIRSVVGIDEDDR